jgi:hypothetical protein
VGGGVDGVSVRVTLSGALHPSSNTRHKPPTIAGRVIRLILSSVLISCRSSSSSKELLREVLFPLMVALIASRTSAHIIGFTAHLITAFVN